MRLEDFLSRLEVSGRDGGGYLCKCPAHDDGRASLIVREVTTRASNRFPFKRKILIHCRAGCDFQSILAAMGLTGRDLYIDEPPNGGKAKKRAADAPPTEDHNRAADTPRRELETAAPSTEDHNRADSKTHRELRAETMPEFTPSRADEIPPWENQAATPSESEPKRREYASYEAATKRLGEIEAVYDYWTRDRVPCFTVVKVRCEDGSKTFRQFRRVIPDKPFPVVMEVKSLPDDQRYVLYRADEVARAISRQQTVIVVEGEKDVETLRGLGYTATCNAGGASSRAGDSKWTSFHADQLRGADVLIIPDHDEAGQRHGQNVAESLRLIANRVRMVDLKDYWSECGNKSDVSDLAKVLGADALKAAIEKMKRDAQEVLFACTAENALAVINAIPGYSAEGNTISYWTGEGTKKLTNFVALPIYEVRQDNGQEIKTEYEIAGWGRDGKAYPVVRVTQAEYNNRTLPWLQEKWGLGATYMPGNGMAGRVQYVISEAGYRNARVITEYTHTGWRKLNGKWCYLYGGGAVGMDHITVSLRGNLKRYTLAGGLDKPWREGARVSWDMRNIMTRRLYIPLMAVTFLAPLRHFLQAAGCTPTFALFLLGITGSHKTVSACLALSHFGDFRHNEAKPATFADTINGVRGLMFALKDMPLLIDDFKPVNSLTERKKMDDMAQALVRSFGDGAGRTVMNADRTVRDAMPPRCLGVMTGEQLPNIDQSGLERLYIVQVRKKDALNRHEEDLPLSEGLTQMQDKAREGYLQASMHGYIKWISRQADDMPRLLSEQFRALRRQAMKRPGRRHDRSPETLAHMMLGYSSFMRYLRDADVISDAEMNAEIALAWDVLCAESDEHGREVAEDAPVQRFMGAVRDMVSSGGMGMKRIGSKGSPSFMCGYVDDDYYYLLPDVTYQMVAEFFSRQNLSLLNKRALYKQLCDEGIIEIDSSGKNTKAKRIDGRLQRLLWIRRSVIDGDQALQQIGFKEVVSDPDDPF